MASALAAGCWLANPAALRAQLLLNGGFESGLANWTSSLSSGGSATFANSTADIHTGTNALQVTVSSAGSASNSVQITSSSFAATAGDTYILRFWASASVDYAPMGINFNGATPTYPQIPFEISTNADSYQEYLYAFRAAGSNASVSFNFQKAGTYWLDDVEVLDLTNSDGWDVTTKYIWQWGQLVYSKTNSTGWGGGDNVQSVALPDGSVAWFFNDTWTMTLTNFYSNIHGGGSLPRNSFVHQVGTNLFWMNNGTATYFAAITNGDVCWIAGCAFETNKIVVLLNELNSGVDENICMDVATISYPGLQLQSVVNVASPGTGNFGYFVKGDDNYYYVYNDAQVARVPVGGLANSSLWTFWNGSSWGTSQSSSVSLPYLDCWSITKIGTSNYCAACFPYLDWTITAQFAPTPMGPWGTPVSIYETPGEWGELNYMPNFEAVSSNTNGVFTMGYSDDGSPDGLSKVAADKSYYNPHYVLANLGKLSPYSPTAATNLALNRPVTASSIDNTNDAAAYAVDGNFSTRWSSAYSDPQWIYVDLGSTQNISQVRLYWQDVSAYGKSYQIQVSGDASNWTTVYSTTNGMGNLEAINFAPSWARYVRMYGTQRGTIWGYSLYEFQVYGTPNVALNSPVAVSSIDNNSDLGQYAVDGNLSTRWSSAYSDPQWITVDLGGIFDVNEFVLNWETAYGKAYQIEVSADSFNWTTVYSETNGAGGTETIKINPTRARWVKMYGTQRGTIWGYSLYEFQIFGAPTQ